MDQCVAQIGSGKAGAVEPGLREFGPVQPRTAKIFMIGTDKQVGEATFWTGQCSAAELGQHLEDAAKVYPSQVDGTHVVQRKDRHATRFTGL